MKALGDSHNFGLRTIVGRDYVEKFRPVYWEWLFLSKESPLRVYCQSEFGADDPFLSFASLNFHSPTSELEHFQFHRIEKLHIEKIADLKACEVFKIGQSFGTCAFFGMTDLHNENFMIGKTSTGKFIASPIDIEICFEEVEALSETHLISSSTVEKHIVSIFDGMSISDEFASGLIDGFLNSWQKLESKAKEIQQLLRIINLSNIPIRLVVTPTSDYKDYFMDKKGLDDFFEEEAIQLIRNDYPYFWTALDSSAAFYFQSENRKKKVADSNIPNLLKNGRRFNLDHILKERSQLKKISILQIARALDKGKPAHISTSNQVHTVYFKDYIYIKTGNKGVKCKRLTNSYSFSSSESSLLAQFKRGNK